MWEEVLMRWCVEAAKAAERAAKEQAAKEKKAAEEANDTAADNYGKLPLHQSQERSGESFRGGG